MSFNFPNTPANGALYTPLVGGPTYVWDTVAWRLSSGGISAGVMISDTAPVNPVHGQLWWESDSGNTFIYYDDGSSAQWIQFNIAPPIPPLAPGFIQKRLFTTSGAITLHADTRYFLAELQGAGGGSGGCSTVATAFAAVGGAGGGGYCSKWLLKAAGMALVYTAGAIGTAGANGSTNGGTGTASTLVDGLGNTMTANGGAGSLASQGGGILSPWPGALGGTAGGGDINIVGGAGGAALGVGTGMTASSGYHGGFSGVGGNSQLGTGGIAKYAYTNVGGGVAAAVGNLYGGGAGGPICWGAGSVVSGNTGALGCLVITEYR
jgi:hypothetical protein